MTGEPEGFGTAGNEEACLALNRAAMAGNVGLAKEALAKGADVHYGRDMALRSAAKAANIEMLVFLMSAAGADVHALNDEALRHAVKNNRETVVKTLLDFGANPDVMEGEPLIHASTKGMTEIAVSLLMHHANPHFSDDQALRQAAYNGHLSIVQALAENKADLFALRRGASVLAASEKHEDVVNYLAERMDGERQAFLSRLSQVTTSNFLRQNYLDTGETAFIRAVKMNCLDEAVARMKATGDCLTCEELHGTKDRHGRSLAILAAENGQLNKLFDIGLWRGTLEDATAAWEKTPLSARKTGGVNDEDFSRVVAGFNQRALKEKAGKFKLKF